jgi:hypothetical protein
MSQALIKTICISKNMIIQNDKFALYPTDVNYVIVSEVIFIFSLGM